MELLLFILILLLLFGGGLFVAKWLFIFALIVLLYGLLVGYGRNY